MGTGVSQAQFYDDTYYIYSKDEVENAEPEDEEINNSTSYYQYDESSRYNDDEDFYYSSQIQRFNRPYTSFNYYSNMYMDPFFNMGWYYPSSYYWYPSNTFCNRPGFYFSFGSSYGTCGNPWNSGWGWSTGWGNNYYGNSFYGNNFYWNNYYGGGYGGYYPGWYNGYPGGGYYNQESYNRVHNRVTTTRRGNSTYDMDSRQVSGRTQTTPNSRYNSRTYQENTITDRNERTLIESTPTSTRTRPVYQKDTRRVDVRSDMEARNMREVKEVNRRNYRSSNLDTRTTPKSTRKYNNSRSIDSGSRTRVRSTSRSTPTRSYTAPRSSSSSGSFSRPSVAPSRSFSPRVSTPRGIR